MYLKGAPLRPAPRASIPCRAATQQHAGGRARLCRTPRVAACGAACWVLCRPPYHRLPQARPSTTPSGTRWCGRSRRRVLLVLLVQLGVGLRCLRAAVASTQLGADRLGSTRRGLPLLRAWLCVALLAWSETWPAGAPSAGRVPPCFLGCLQLAAVRSAAQRTLTASLKLAAACRPRFTFRGLCFSLQFTGEAEHTLTASVELIATTRERKPWSRPPLSMSFQVPAALPVLVQPDGWAASRSHGSCTLAADVRWVPTPCGLHDAPIAAATLAPAHRGCRCPCTAPAASRCST